MGSYIIHIEGVGPHHNVPGINEFDADRVAKEVVDLLIELGHTVTAASFIQTGQIDNLLSGTKADPS